jgi:hypothetical protein
MKFTTAWANVLTQNLTLRAGVLLLALCALVFSISTVRLALRDPIVIERECFSKAMTPMSTKHTSAEIDAFIRVAIGKRFDSDATDYQVYLSDAESGFRGKEQTELSKRGMSQRIIVNSTKVDGSNVTVDADRLIAVGKIKSVLPLPVTVNISTTDRTAANPYGLVMRRVSQIKQEEESK